jgi:glutamate dehydrogenase
MCEYFPTPLRDLYADRMSSHRLRRDIITTSLVNEVVNRGGITFVYRAVEESGATPADVIRAYTIVRDVYGLNDLWHAVEALDSDPSVPTAAQTAVYLEIRRLMDRAVRWLLSARRAPLDVPREIAKLGPGVASLLPHLDDLIRGNEREALQSHVQEIIRLGVPKDLAESAARVMYGFGLLDVVHVAESTEHDLYDVAGVYFLLSERFRVDALLSRISALPRENRWETLARMALRYDLYAALSALTGEVLGSAASPSSSLGQDASVDDKVDAWEQSNSAALARTRTAIGEFDESRADLAVLSVLLRQIRTLVQTAAA